MIFKGEKKAVICKGDFHPAQFYKGDKKITGYSLEEFQGTDNATLENCYNDKIYDVQINSKNLLDVKKVYPDLVNEENGITFTRQNLVTLYSKNLCNKYKEKTAYTFSCDYEIAVDNNAVYPYVVYTDGTKQGFYSNMASGTGNFSGHCKITTNSNKTVKTITFGYTTSTRDCNGKLTNMQLKEGNKETEYEPPCRNATITARGKNILDMSQHKVSQGYYNDTAGQANYKNTDFIFIVPIAVKPNTMYTFSSNLIIYTVWFASDGGVLSGGAISKIRGEGKNIRVFTTPENCSHIRVSFYLVANDKVEEGVSAFEWAMLELGEGDGVYEPYREPQTIPFENGNLAAEIPTFKGTTIIEVESDVPATISGKYKKVEV